MRSSRAMALKRSIRLAISRAVPASSMDCASRPSPTSPKARFMASSGRSTNTVMSPKTTSPMKVARSRKNPTSRMTFSRRAWYCCSSGMTMLMAPPMESSVQPSFGNPVMSISPAGSPWHSRQLSFTLSACT